MYISLSSLPETASNIEWNFQRHHVSPYAVAEKVQLILNDASDIHLDRCTDTTTHGLQRSSPTANLLYGPARTHVALRDSRPYAKVAAPLRTSARTAVMCASDGDTKGFQAMNEPTRWSTKRQTSSPTAGPSSLSSSGSGSTHPHTVPRTKEGCN